MLAEATVILSESAVILSEAKDPPVPCAVRPWPRRRDFFAGAQNDTAPQRCRCTAAVPLRLRNGRGGGSRLPFFIALLLSGDSAGPFRVA